MVAELDEQTAAAMGVAVAQVSAKVVEVFAEPSLVFITCWLLPSIAYIMCVGNRYGQLQFAHQQRRGGRTGGSKTQVTGENSERNVCRAA